MRSGLCTSWLSRMGFIAAGLAALLAVAEKIANMNGQTMSWIDYSAGRILEFAAILLLFVIALQLRLIRRALEARD